MNYLELMTPFLVEIYTEAVDHNSQLSVVKLVVYNASFHPKNGPILDLWRDRVIIVLECNLFFIYPYCARPKKTIMFLES